MVGGCTADAEGSQWIAVARTDELEGGEAVPFELPDGSACFVVRLNDTAEHGVGPQSRIVAFSSVCPHMGCPLGLDGVDAATGCIGPCGCHQSLFDLRRDGGMVYGRAASNLPRIELRVEGEQVLARAPVRLAYGEALSEDTALSVPNGGA